MSYTEKFETTSNHERNDQHGNPNCSSAIARRSDATNPIHLSTRLGAAKERLQFFGIFQSGRAAFSTKCRLAPGALRISCFRLSVGDGCAYEISVAVRMPVLCFVSNALITQGKGFEFS